MWLIFVVMYLLYVITMSVCSVLVTVVVLRVNLHAHSKPLVEMPAWVRMPSSG